MNAPEPDKASGVSGGGVGGGAPGGGSTSSTSDGGNSGNADSSGTTKRTEGAGSSAFSVMKSDNKLSVLQLLFILIVKCVMSFQK